MNWKGLACAAAAALACSSAAFAADSNQSSAANVASMITPNYIDDTTTAPATEAAPAASAPSQTTLTPVMFLLDPTPVGQWLEKYKFNITGFVEPGYFIDTNNPRAGTGPNGDNPTLVTFPGQYSNHFMLDQLDLTLSKGLDTTKSFDWGFLFEQGFGTDDSYTHSHGLLDNRPPGDPQNQYDILQLNGSLLLPVGTGLTVTFGKFVAFQGEELINPTANYFFTHSYSFFYGIPATNTGVTASYTLAKLVNGNDWTFTAGGTNGWNQSLRDNNDAIDFLGQAKGQITSKLGMVFNIEEGPEATHDNSDYWTNVELIPTYAVSDQLTLVGDFTYTDFPHGATTAGGVSAQWYGGVLYADYKLNSMFSINLRTEWYRDQGAFSTGTQANYYEGTLGCQIHPLPNDNIFQWLQFRPEIRVDDSDRRVFNTAHDNGAGDYSQVTFAVDAIMQF